MKYAMEQHLNLSDSFTHLKSDNLQYYDSIKFYLSKTLKVKGDIFRIWYW